VRPEAEVNVIATLGSVLSVLTGHATWQGFALVPDGKATVLVALAAATLTCRHRLQMTKAHGAGGAPGDRAPRAVSDPLLDLAADLAGRRDGRVDVRVREALTDRGEHSGQLARGNALS